MTFEEILQQIEAKNFAPIYFLHGEEPYFIDKIEASIDAHVLPDAEKSFNQILLYGKEVQPQPLLDLLRRYPMMSQHLVVILREAQEMKGLTDLVAYVENPTPTTIFVVCHKHKKLDMRTKFAAALSSSAVVFESRKLYDYQLPDWITKYCQSQKRNIEPTAAALLAEYLGNDLAKVTNELDKIFLNLPVGAVVTPEHIQQFVGISKEYNIFELQKAMAARDMPRVAHIARHFEANIRRNPLVVTISALYNFFSKVYQLQELQAQGKKESEMLKLLDLRSEWFLRDYKLAARNFDRQQIENIITQLKNYDLRSKGVGADTTHTGEEQLQKELLFKILHF